MKIESIGGYGEIGKNMTAVTVDGETLILDMGVHVEALVGQGIDMQKMSTRSLVQLGVLPDYRKLEGKKVVGVCISHGHLDHLGAVTRIAPLLKAPVYVAPFSREIIKAELRMARNPPRVDLRTVKCGNKVKIGKNFEVQFVPTAHSIPDASILAVKTKEGTLVYTPDFKFDQSPIIGNKTDMRTLSRLAPVKVTLVDSTRIERLGTTPSESVAKMMIEHAFVRPDAEGIIATTFSSQIARISSLIAVGNRLKRKIVLIGRSLEKYTTAARKLGYLKMKGAKVYGSYREYKSVLAKANLNKKDYFIICTGTQGEPNSVLGKMVDGKLPFKVGGRDWVAFCSEVIPSPINIGLREELESKLQNTGARIFRDLHVSGHPSKEDVRTLIRTLKPKTILPAHGDMPKQLKMAELAMEEGYELGKNIFLLKDGQSIDL